MTYQGGDDCKGIILSAELAEGKGKRRGRAAISACREMKERTWPSDSFLGGTKDVLGIFTFMELLFSAGVIEYVYQWTQDCDSLGGSP